MSVYSGPEISNDGLVFAYDMSNTQKSWKGAPTTNSVTDALAMTGWNNYSNGTPVAITTSLGTPGYGFYNAGSWNGIFRSITIPSTGIYTFSAWVKYIGGSTNNNGGGVYISGWGGGDSATVTNRTLPGQWQRLSITLNCTNTTFTFFLISWGGTNNADNSSWEMTMPQAEPGSFITPFVNGTRSNTQAVLDLVGNNTITATSLTYASDGTFSFNGSGDRITSNSSIFNKTNGQEITVSCWIKPNRLSGQYSVFCTNRSTDAGTYNWIFYQHTNDGAISFHGAAQNKSTYVPSIGSWINVTNTVTAAGVSTLYVNGISTFVVNGFTYGGTPSLLGIGANPAGQEPFQGSIANVQIYNRSLSAAEVAQNFNAHRGRFNI
jgi:hypothetical protein